MYDKEEMRKALEKKIAQRCIKMVAYDIGITPLSLNNFMKGKHEATMTTLIKIKVYLDQ